MKIYPDPELPDIVVEWDVFTCEEQPGDVRVALYAFEGTDPLAVTTVPCGELSVRFEDVGRERYRVSGELGSGEETITSEGLEVDLRDGVNERVYMYFDTFSNVRVSWSFEEGASCASLGTPWMAIDIGMLAEPDFVYSNFTSCDFTPYGIALPEGAYRLRLRAITGPAADGPTVAASPVQEVTVGLGTMGLSFVLAPCGAECPSGPEPQL